MSIQMFALPYAGGSASIYNDWVSKLKPSINVCPIEYAGHGSRFCEDFYLSIEDAADDISEMIKSQQEEDYVIYGHSMGCLVALETAFVLSRKNAVMPKAIIVAATRPPHLMHKDRPLGNLSKDELMKAIAALGQFEPEIFEYEELYELISDIMYADVQMFTKYKRRYDTEKIDIPLIVLTGDGDDEAPAEDMKEWQYYTSGSFSFNEFKGNHFFAFNDNEEFLGYIKKLITTI